MTSPTQTGVSAPVIKPTITQDTANGTEYVIVTFNEDSDEWAEHGDHVKATSPAGAIRKHLGNFPGHPGGTYIAIPARSWKPVKVTPQTVTTLKLEEAK